MLMCGGGYKPETTSLVLVMNTYIGSAVIAKQI